MRKLQTLSIILFISLLVSCQTQPSAQDGASSTGVPLQVPSFTPGREPSELEPAKCWFQVPQDATVTCEYVLVPEDRSQVMTEKNTIRLAVAIFHSTSQTPAPDPIVYHVGGPGDICS